MKNDFASDVKKILEQYQVNAIEVMNEVIDEVAKEGSKRLRQSSPRRTGKYAKGWTQTVEKGRLTISAVIHGKSGTYQLAHLLENGHLTRNGGRTKAISHIEPVNEWVIDEAVKRTISKLETMR